MATSTQQLADEICSLIETGATDLAADVVELTNIIRELDGDGIISAAVGAIVAAAGVAIDIIADGLALCADII